MSVVVVIRSVEERTERACAHIVRSQLESDSSIHLVRNKPFAEAHIESMCLAAQSKAKWALFLDADVLLRDDAIPMMLQEAEAVAKPFYMLKFPVLDLGFDGPAYAGVHLYSVEHFETALQLSETAYGAQRPESHLCTEMAHKAGVPSLRSAKLVGLHGYEQFYADIYRTTFVRAVKFARHTDYLLRLYRSRYESDSEDNYDYRVMLWGLLDGGKRKKRAVETNPLVRNPFKFAYVSRVRYPDGAASALQIFRMAVALSHRLDTTLFVHDLELSEADIYAHYGVEAAPLKIQSLHSGCWPRFVYRRGRWRHLTYNVLVALLLGVRRRWRTRDSAPNVFFVRSQRETLFWGLRRRLFPWLRRWIFVCELHDLFLPGDDELSTQSSAQSQAQVQRLVRALQAYDLVLALTHALADDVRAVTRDAVVPLVVPTCTGLDRAAVPSAPSHLPAGGRIVLGYIGTVDVLHGVRDLFEALHLLPDTFTLRVVGRVGAQTQKEVARYLADSELAQRLEVVGPVPYSQIAHQVDACDLLLAPAGITRHSKKYRSPLKIFDYMARGKPIVAADVPAHRELLQDGVNARLYRAGDAEHLAAVVRELAGDPAQMQAIARRAWEQSAEYTYEARAERIIELIESTRKEKSRD